MQATYSSTGWSVSTNTKPSWGVASDKKATKKSNLAPSGLIQAATICLMTLFPNFTSSSVQTPAIETTFQRNQPVLARFSNAKKVSNDSSVVENKTIAEQVQLLKDAFGLNTSDIAKLMNVSRPTVYSWMKGTVPAQEETMLQLQRLSDTAMIFKLQNIVRPDTLMRRPIFEGRTAFDLLQENKVLSSEQISAMKSIDSREHAIRLDVDKGRNKQFRDARAVVDDVIDPISVIIYE